MKGYSLEHVQDVNVENVLVGKDEGATGEKGASLLVEELADDITVLGGRDERTQDFALVRVGARGVVVGDEETVARVSTRDLAKLRESLTLYR